MLSRLGLRRDETEFVSWLILEHLTMSDVAFKRDGRSQTIERFADRVIDVEHLALHVLTVCDISAVGPDTWTTGRLPFCSSFTLQRSNG